MIFVLVHPAWFGGWCWRKVTPLLRDRGHEVYTPTLTGLGERAHLASREISLATHIEDVVNVLQFEDLHRVILIGNSSGGMVITGVADRVPKRIAQVVYLDAFVPGDGQSLVDLLPPDRRQEMENLVKVEGQGWLLPRFAPLPPEKILRDIWGVTSDDDVSWALARLRKHALPAFYRPGKAYEASDRRRGPCVHPVSAIPAGQALGFRPSPGDGPADSRMACARDRDATPAICHPSGGTG